MTCDCGYVDPSPTITGIYTLPGKVGCPEIFYGVGYTCKGCGTDGTILAADTTAAQVQEGHLAELSRDGRSEMIFAERR